MRKDNIQPVNQIPVDAIAFCELLARILYRCLKDRSVRMLLYPVAVDHPANFSSHESTQEVQNEPSQAL